MLMHQHSTMRIERWVDPVVDRRGHDPRSMYVERYWLGAIGPSATWIIRRFADRFDDAPQGFDMNPHDLAGELGMSYARGDRSPFGRALQRCVMFGLARPTPDGLAVRRRRVEHREPVPRRSNSCVVRVRRGRALAGQEVAPVGAG